MYGFALNSLSPLVCMLNLSKYVCMYVCMYVRKNIYVECRPKFYMLLMCVHVCLYALKYMYSMYVCTLCMYVRMCVCTLCMYVRMCVSLGTFPYRTGLLAPSD